MPLHVTWERGDSILGSQLGDKATSSSNAAKHQAMLDPAIGSNGKALLLDLEQPTR